MKQLNRVVAIALALAACGPDIGPRLECDDAGGCPSDRICENQRCVPLPDANAPPPGRDRGVPRPDADVGVPPGDADVGPPPAHGPRLEGRLVWTGGPLGDSGWGAGIFISTQPAVNAAGDQLRGGLVGP